MSFLSQFTNKVNINLLWEVLLDELHINMSNKILIGNIRTVFESNINPFSSRVNTNINIMEMNKQFLSQVVLAVNRLFPNFASFSDSNQKQTQEQDIKRIKIYDEEVLEPYKIEDIHASRQSEFEKEVERKRMEMENYMSPEKPRDLDFSDRNTDSKIKAMDSLVANKMAQRNLEIEQYQNSNYNSSIDPDQWLTPKETSVKNDKTLIEQKSIIKYSQNSRLKYIAIDSNNTTSLIDDTENKSQPFAKNVSWDDQESTINIFNKLKKQPIIEPIFNTIKNNVTDIEQKQYIEQKSIQLPEVKQEEIIRNKITLPIPNNEPIIPKTEIIKQLNEMNKKIDTLYEMIYNLTNLIEKINNTEILEENNTLD